MSTLLEKSKRPSSVVSTNPRVNKANTKDNQGSIITPNGQIRKVRDVKASSVVSQQKQKRATKIPNGDNISLGSPGSIVSNGGNNQRRKTIKSGHGSTVSSQIERRKSRGRISNGITSRRSSVGRHSGLDVESTLIRSQSEGMIDECSATMREMEPDELDKFLEAIKIFQKFKEQEERKKVRVAKKIEAIKTKIRERSQSQADPRCCCCQVRWIPFVRNKYTCFKCKFDVCKDCCRYNFTLCKDCYELIITEAKLCDIFTNHNLTDILIDVRSLEKTAHEVKERESLYSGRVDSIDNASSIASNNILRSVESSSTINEAYPISHMSGPSISESQNALDVDEYISKSGKLQLAISYNHKKQTLQVIVKSAKQLIPITKNNTCNSFVRLCLLPDSTGSNKRRTRIIQDNVSPQYNEVVKFKYIPWDEVLARLLNITVWHHEWLIKDIFMGEIKIKLDVHNFDDASPKWYDLQNQKPITMHPNITKYCGDLHIGIKILIKESKFNPNEEGDTEIMSQSERTTSQAYVEPNLNDLVNIDDKVASISVWIKNASNLLTGKYDKLPSAYTKCVIHPEKEFNLKKKTPVIRKNFNPDWNTLMEFHDIVLNKEKIILEMSVWDKKVGLIPDALLGVVFLDISDAAKQIQIEAAENLPYYKRDNNDSLIKQPNAKKHQDITLEQELTHKLFQQRNRWFEIRLPLHNLTKSEYEAAKS